MSTERTCSHCRYSHAFQASGRPITQCRAEPPKVRGSDGITIWPIVQPHYTCGAFSERPLTDEQRRARREQYERAQRELTQFYNEQARKQRKDR